MKSSIVINSKIVTSKTAFIFFLSEDSIHPALKPFNLNDWNHRWKFHLRSCERKCCFWRLNLPGPLVFAKTEENWSYSTETWSEPIKTEVDTRKKKRFLALQQMWQWCHCVWGQHSGGTSNQMASTTVLQRNIFIGKALTIGIIIATLISIWFWKLQKMTKQRSLELILMLPLKNRQTRPYTTDWKLPRHPPTRYPPEEKLKKHLGDPLNLKLEQLHFSS